MEMPLRAHHLLCTVLFVGAGYSPAFTENMSRAVARLHAGQPVRLAQEPDAICAACPNRLPDGACALDADAPIASTDQRLLERLRLRSDACYAPQELFALVKARLTAADFEELCANCRWYRAGYCSYEKYMERIESFLSPD
ncbi:MAG: DUF1284 domain-containing protein [Firmicutes bacterium]|nr:DUF1284 domain-containing protein [Bacillota bacterium]